MKKRKIGRSLRAAMVAALAVCMLLSLVGCGDPKEETTAPAVQTQPPQTTGHTHQYVEKVTKEATCSESGTKTFTCECGDQYTEEISALGHSYQDATCTAPKTCTICGATEDGAKDHSWQDATCTAPKTCTVCGATEGDALGHSWQDATCTESKTCTTCGATEGNALGHSWQDATCTAPKACTTCGTTEGEALGHSWKDATCAAPKTCSACGKTEGSALDHNYKNGACTSCGQVEPSVAVVGEWFLEGLNDSGVEYEKMYLTLKEGTASITISYFGKLEYDSQEMLDFILANGYYDTGEGYMYYYDIVQYKGVYYHSAMYGYFAEGTYAISGNTVTLTLTSCYGITGELVLKLSSASSLEVVRAEEQLFDETICEVFYNGRVFKKVG